MYLHEKLELARRVAKTYGCLLATDTAWSPEHGFCIRWYFYDGDWTGEPWTVYAHELDGLDYDGCCEHFEHACYKTARNTYNRDNR